MRFRQQCPAREGIPMQSSFWKLLTAAGIIGLGTLGVLEVQHRLSARNAATSAAKTSTAGTDQPGTEVAVVPDATTDFDRMMASTESFSGLDEPADSGDVTPAAATLTDNSRFFGSEPVNQTVNKDELTEGQSPFVIEDSVAAEPLASGDGSPVIANSQQPVAADSSSASINPASFRSDQSPVGQTSAADAADDALPIMTLPTDVVDDRGGRCAVVAFEVRALERALLQEALDDPQRQRRRQRAQPIRRQMPFSSSNPMQQMQAAPIPARRSHRQRAPHHHPEKVPLALLNHQPAEPAQRAGRLLVTLPNHKRHQRSSARQ